MTSKLTNNRDGQQRRDVHWGLPPTDTGLTLIRGPDQRDDCGPACLMRERWADFASPAKELACWPARSAIVDLDQ